jgi:hypothetical protein
VAAPSVANIAYSIAQYSKQIQQQQLSTKKKSLSSANWKEKTSSATCGAGLCVVLKLGNFGK